MTSKRDNFEAVNELRESIGLMRKHMDESFVIANPEKDIDKVGEENDDISLGKEDFSTEVTTNYNEDVKKAIKEIRKIVIGVIAKLADEPSSDSYEFMKRLLDMSDKAMLSLFETSEQ